MEISMMDGHGGLPMGMIFSWVSCTVKVMLSDVDEDEDEDPTSAMEDSGCLVTLI